EHLDRCLTSPFCRKKAHVLLATVLERQGQTAAAARAAELAEKSPADANLPDPVLELVDEVTFGPMVIAGRASQILGQGRNRDAIGLLRGTALRYPEKDYIWLMLGQVLISEKEY